MPTENDIRDRLSKTLGVLEPGLTLIDVNHKLPNAVGARGSSTSSLATGAGTSSSSS